MRFKSIVIAVAAGGLLGSAGCTKKDSGQEKAPAAATAKKEPGVVAKLQANPTPVAAAPTSPVLGKPAPDFTLEAIDGSKVSLASFKGKIVVLEWFNPQCPFVVRAHTKGSLVATAKKHTDAGVVWLAINSSGAGKEGFDVKANQDVLATWSIGHPVLRDVDGAVGKAYGATNTPNMFVIDAAGTVVYAGAIDNSPDGEGQSPTGGTLVNHVDAAVADLVAGKPVATPITKPYGCSVKYAS
jgi:peroxiredoxin